MKIVEQSISAWIMESTTYNKCHLLPKTKCEVLKCRRANEKLGRGYNNRGSQLVGKPEASEFSNTGMGLAEGNWQAHSQKRKQWVISRSCPTYCVFLVCIAKWYMSFGKNTFTAQDSKEILQSTGFCLPTPILYFLFPHCNMSSATSFYPFHHVPLFFYDALSSLPATLQLLCPLVLHIPHDTFSAPCSNNL